MNGNIYEMHICIHIIHSVDCESNHCSAFHPAATLARLVFLLPSTLQHQGSNFAFMHLSPRMSKPAMACAKSTAKPRHTAASRG